MFFQSAQSPQPAHLRNYRCQLLTKPKSTRMKGGEYMNKTLRKVGAGITTLAIAAASFAMPAMAAGNVTYTPFTFIGAAGDCGTGYPAGTPGGASATNSGGQLTLTKSAPTSDCSAAGATLNGVSGLSTTGMTLSFDYNGYCGAGAPRFNVSLSDGSTVFLGCAYGGGPTGTNVSGTATFTAGNTYGGVLFPTGATVTGIEIIQDEQGSVTLSNIMVNGTTAVYANTPTTKDDCKNGGYKTLTNTSGQTFKNQGQCVSYFEHVSH